MGGAQVETILPPGSLLRKFPNLSPSLSLLPVCQRPPGVCFVSFGGVVMFSRWTRSLLSMSNVIPLGLRQEFSLLSRCTYAAVAAAPAAGPDPVDKPLSSNPTVKLEKLFWSKPSSLALPLDSPLRIEEPNYEGIRRFILKIMLFYSKQSKSIRGANVVYKRIVSQVDKPAIYDVFNLEKTFRTTFSVLVLHMWLSLRRLKTEGKEGVEFGQYLYEIYNHDVELRVSKAGVNLLLIRWMKDLEKIFYGNIVAYDSAMLPEAKHDELANAMWRNIFSDDGSPIPIDATAQSAVQAFARYARRECYCLSMTDKEAIFSGNFMFTSLKHETERLKK